MLYFHDIKKNESKLVYETNEHPKWMHSGKVSDDGKWLLITTNESCDPVNSVYVVFEHNFNRFTFSCFDSVIQITEMVLKKRHT